MGLGAIFLDRDGTLNAAKISQGRPIPPASISEVVILDGVESAIKTFIDLDLIPVIITNQPDVARGKTEKQIVESINEFIAKKLNIGHVYTCFHDELECECRKPKPGLILKAASEIGIDLTSSFMVGDRWKDIAAGQAAGCDCYYIDNKYDEISPELPFTRVTSVLEVSKLLSEKS